jgi:hypothetical protein
MESKTTIQGMVMGNKIYVPDYQRAYSWEIKSGESSPKQVDVFLSDLEDYLKSGTKTPYYFGHFLYEKAKGSYAVIDGQQRLTTIIIFLCALFRRIQKDRDLDEEESKLYQIMIKWGSTYSFSTVGYDDGLFKDYVIDGVKKDHNGIETVSGRRIVEAYDFFTKKLQKKDLAYIVRLVEVVTNAICTTHIVEGEAEAVQMFIFQNNRGKKPSRLEVIKAQFMYNIHVFGGNDAEALIGEVKRRFELVYRCISSIEEFVDEDDVLSQTVRVYFNSLWESDTMEKIVAELASPKRLQFISDFSLSLERSFHNLAKLNEDRKNNVTIEASLLVGRFNIILPFFIKAYTNGISLNDVSRLAKALGDLVLRDAIIGTRADLRTRLDDVFKKFDDSVDDIVDRVEMMKKTDDWWWGYWNDNSFRQFVVDNWWWSKSNELAKIVLWKYENYLIEKEGKKGYAPIPFDSVLKPHLEHIAPQTENGEKVASGYCKYDDDFKENYLYKIGNFLLLSAPHNESIGNRPFEVKRNSYTQLRQQREIQEMTESDHVWNKKKIQMRQDKIVDFIMENL